MARDAFQRGFTRFAHPAVVSPGVFGPAALPRNRILPESLQHPRRLLEARIGNRGNREFIHLLRPREFFSEPAVATAALDAIRLGAIGFDAARPPSGAGSFG